MKVFQKAIFKTFPDFSKGLIFKIKHFEKLNQIPNRELIGY